MEGGSAAAEKRPVLVHTLYGLIEGWLNVNPRVRTSDYLNLACPKFLMLGVEDNPFPSWSLGGGVLGVNTTSVVFVMELGNHSPMTDERIEASRFTRAGVRLRLADYDVQGFMHVPALSDPMIRLHQNRQPFIALTSVSAVGPEREFAAAFLAANPQHILAVQPIDHREPLPLTTQSGDRSGMAF